MNVYAVSTRIEGYQVLFKLANTANSAFKSLFDKDALLRMNNLVVALLQISVNIDVFDVQTSEMLESLIRLPGFDVFYPEFILLSGYMFHLNLFLEIIHGICQL